MTTRPLFDVPIAKPKLRRSGSKTPVISVPAKIPERWIIEFSGRDDEVPLICRVRRMLKSAGRAYRLKARIVAQPGPDSTLAIQAHDISSEAPAGQPNAATQAAEGEHAARIIPD